MRNYSFSKSKGTQQEAYKEISVIQSTILINLLILIYICCIFPKASDLGQVWGWGYGGEGQLGLGSRIRTVSSPHPIPCIDTAFYGKDRASSMIANNRSSEGALSKVTGTCVKDIACGGRHSAVVTGICLSLYSSFCSNH